MNKWDKFDSLDDMTPRERREFEDKYKRIGRVEDVPNQEQLKEMLAAEAGYNDDAEYAEVRPPKFNYDAIGDLVGPHRYGMPYLLDRADIQVMFKLPKRSAQRLIRRHLVPMGAVVRVGSKYLIQPWGLYRLLNPNGRCAYCGVGGKGECEKLPVYSVGPLPTEKSDLKHKKAHTDKKSPIEEI